MQDWYRRERRELPWRATRDPYRILVSEVMLQQTRAQAVIPYYHKFLERFPTLQVLAVAAESDVLACWSGLGYYARARNLQAAAREIVAAGRFPQDYESIRQLPGVGPYTAAAVASIAFRAPRVVLDGNVMRVISRLTNDAGDLASPQTRARFHATAKALLDSQRPGRFNQAMMELGATICVPKAPQCPLCPVSPFCEARRRGTERQLPVKLSRPVPTKILSKVIIVENQGKILLWQRQSGSRRMAGFWELPEPEQLDGMRSQKIIGSFRHTITRHHYIFTVISARTKRTPRRFRWFSKGRLQQIPLSTTAKKALQLFWLDQNELHGKRIS